MGWQLGGYHNPSLDMGDLWYIETDMPLVTLRGRFRNGYIELDEDIGLPVGTELTIEVTPVVRSGILRRVWECLLQGR